MVPSLDQITPEPLPRPLAWMTTVERRSFSAISPNPVTAISFASMRAFPDYDGPFLDGAATNDLERE